MVTLIHKLVFAKTENWDGYGFPKHTLDEKALGKAGIDNFHFHDLRHTFVTRFAQKGVAIYTIAKLPGGQGYSEDPTVCTSLSGKFKDGNSGNRKK